jgi:prolyl oligopeptidase
MGTPEAQDIVLREASPEGHWLWPSVTNSRRAVVITERDTTAEKDEVHVLSLVGASRGRGLKLVSGFDAQYEYFGNRGEELWFKTDLDAPNRRVIAIDLLHPERERWRELVPERDAALDEASAVGGHILLSYLRDAHSELRVHATDGGLVRTQELPGLGTATGFGGEFDDPETTFVYTSFTTPAEVWSLDVAGGETRLLRRPDVDLDPEDYEVRQVFYHSPDGTRVPMFLVQRRGLERTGDRPTYLYGYGGFNISMTPSYGTQFRVWIERGGLLAIPNLRGGGEYGEAWHRAGTKLQKQNVFDDFIAAAEYLVAEGYTSPAHLAISGGSNGGLLVGACMTQRPELFAASLPAVGVLDMLRYQHFTIGWAWARDYGTSADSAEFAALHAYSPLHNVREGVRYPATLVTTGDHDDRVVPAHSYKFAARLQAAGASDTSNPYLIRIETRAGHGAGKATSALIDESADELAFLEHFTRP